MCEALQAKIIELENSVQNMAKHLQQQQQQQLQLQEQRPLHSSPKVEGNHLLGQPQEKLEAALTAGNPKRASAHEARTEETTDDSPSPTGDGERGDQAAKTLLTTEGHSATTQPEEGTSRELPPPPPSHAPRREPTPVDAVNVTQQNLGPGLPRPTNPRNNQVRAADKQLEAQSVKQPGIQGNVDKQGCRKRSQREKRRTTGEGAPPTRASDCAGCGSLQSPPNEANERDRRHETEGPPFLSDPAKLPTEGNTEGSSASWRRERRVYS
ncbi:hypothetical protein MTO96_026623 [Rhipicephalus appendiculatus]